jgi:hypothetical protein
MPFSNIDFIEHHEKLRVIAYSKLGLNYFQLFRDLSTRNQKNVNREINAYITALPNEGYIEVITELFNEIARDEIFDSKFHKSAAAMVVRKSTKEELAEDDEATQHGVSQYQTTMDEVNNIKH